MPNLSELQADFIKNEGPKKKKKKKKKRHHKVEGSRTIEFEKWSEVH